MSQPLIQDLFFSYDAGDFKHGVYSSPEDHLTMFEEIHQVIGWLASRVSWVSLLLSWCFLGNDAGDH